jgi:hypothetical protein
MPHPPVKSGVGFAKQDRRVNSSDRESRRRVCGQEHVQTLLERRWIEHSSDRVDARDPTT